MNFEILQAMSEDVSNNSGSSGIWNLLGGIGSAGLNFLSQVFTNHQTEKMMDKRNQQAIEQWNRENEYNDPRAVIARLQRAGLSPAMMYGEGTGQLQAASSPNMEQSNPLTAPQIDPYTASSIRLNNAQADLLKAQADTEDDTRAGKVSQLDSSVKSLLQTVEESKQKVQNMIQELANLKEDHEHKETDNMYYSSVLSYLISQAKSEALLKQDQYFAFYKGFLAELGLKSAQSSYYRALSFLSRKQAQQVEFLTKKAKEMWDIDSKYYGSNAYNDALLKYVIAKNAKEMNEFWNENKDVDWWFDHITESLNTLFKGVSAAADIFGK